MNRLLTCVCADVDRLWADASVDFDVLLGKTGTEFGYLGYTTL